MPQIAAVPDAGVPVVSVGLNDVGRIVHYWVSETDLRPAMIVRVLGDGIVNLQVFTDGVEDATAPEPDWTIDHPGRGDAHKGLYRRTEVAYGNKPGNWSWPDIEIG